MTAELWAQDWHDDNEPAHRDRNEYGGCWCCCNLCEQNNPYYESAVADRLPPEKKAP